MILLFAAVSYGDDDTLKLPNFNPQDTKSKFEFSKETDSKIDEMEKNPTLYSQNMELFMGTSSHGYMPANPCVSADTHVQYFLAAKEIAAYIVLSLNDQKLNTIQLPHKNAHNIIKTLRSSLAKDILSVNHVWTTNKDAKLNSLTNKLSDDIIFSWVKYSEMSKMKDQNKCLTNDKVVRTLIQSSMFHQNSWLPTKLSEKQIIALTKMFINNL